ncbi:MAG: nucleotidyltransferase domain-containing protein [Gammaproteobacteria bacterium]|nr:nucleotidyltransferase domain-containing protein [Gammaproteobacteria bacterium]
MIHVFPEHLDMIRRVLKSHVPEWDVWVFGSRVHERNLKPYSDLDLAVMTDKPLCALRYTGLQEAFSESDLPFKVDIVDWAAAGASFREVISGCHEVLQRGGKQSARDHCSE